MPFSEAKKIVESKIAPHVKESKSVLMKAAYLHLLNKFDSHTKKAREYIAHAGGSSKEKQNYLITNKKIH